MAQKGYKSPANGALRSETGKASRRISILKQTASANGSSHWCQSALPTFFRFDSAPPDTRPDSFSAHTGNYLSKRDVQPPPPVSFPRSVGHFFQVRSPTLKRLSGWPFRGGLSVYVATRTKRLQENIGGLVFWTSEVHRA